MVFVERWSSFAGHFFNKRYEGFVLNKDDLRRLMVYVVSGGKHCVFCCFRSSYWRHNLFEVKMNSHQECTWPCIGYISLKAEDDPGLGKDKGEEALDLDWIDESGHWKNNQRHFLSGKNANTHSRIWFFFGSNIHPIIPLQKATTSQKQQRVLKRHFFRVSKTPLNKDHSMSLYRMGIQ